VRSGEVGGGISLLSYQITSTLEEATEMGLDTLYVAYREPGSQGRLEAAGSLGDCYP